MKASALGPMDLAQAGDAKASPKLAATIPAPAAVGRNIRDAVWEKSQRNLKGGNQPELDVLRAKSGLASFLAPRRLFCSWHLVSLMPGAARQNVWRAAL